MGDLGEVDFLHFLSVLLVFFQFWNVRNDDISLLLLFDVGKSSLDINLRIFLLEDVGVSVFKILWLLYILPKCFWSIIVGDWIILSQLLLDLSFIYFTKLEELGTFWVCILDWWTLRIRVWSKDNCFWHHLQDRLPSLVDLWFKDRELTSWAFF